MAKETAERLFDWLNLQRGWSAKDMLLSPIVGGDGNLEYLLFGEKSRVNNNVRIDHIGANGSGIIKTLHDLVPVPFTLPGECVEIAVHGKNATLIALKEKSPERIDALCQHFGECGRCAFQHWHVDAYRAWMETTTGW